MKPKSIFDPEITVLFSFWEFDYKNYNVGYRAGDIFLVIEVCSYSSFQRTSFHLNSLRSNSTFLEFRTKMFKEGFFVDIKKVHYEFYELDYFRDIALLELDGKLPLASPLVMPACLPNIWDDQKQFNQVLMVRKSVYYTQFLENLTFYKSFRPLATA